ncbi:cobyric acid synthase [Acidisoma cellulosilytica]|uniref:Cobyric acid synthase n=1 Tax=Acidisoma cellulosilyticum TaxID=2802395 RepID=A0A963Z5R0_9PROT|nr:cobyric acid synthase [Acidisoma cellulosilyticum]MCB8883339.1 cobyric acid synthase [Acidisoma cellulosilyticum]
MTAALMIQGTGSSVGKSTLVAGLCRLLTRQGFRVRPFKPQNMSNNAAVTADGGEIGRAQALQALACRVPPSVHMNPILLKPQSETGSQIIVQGRVWGQARARDYQALKPQLLPYVLDSFAKLRAEADIVLVEGAGSASEVNLRAHDIANMGFARATGLPVILVGDIDRGGVIGSLVGTHSVLDEDDRALIRGFIVNRMRGDLSLFDDGMRFIADRTGWAPLGLVPHFTAAHRLPAEDAADLGSRASLTPTGGKLRIAVPVLPGIANFDDLDPLAAEPEVTLLMLRDGAPLPPDIALVILPGSKTTIRDLAALRAYGWDSDILAHARRGGHVLGLCGGYQMLGRTIADPDGIEGPPALVPGLGLLDVETVLQGPKQLRSIAGHTVADGLPLSGYEMHMGVTTGPATAHPVLTFTDGRSDGAISDDARVIGSYVHGFFADDRQRSAWLTRFGAPPSDRAHASSVEAVLDALADHLAQHCDIPKIQNLAASGTLLPS